MLHKFIFKHQDVHLRRLSTVLIFHPKLVKDNRFEINILAFCLCVEGLVREQEDEIIIIHDISLKVRVGRPLLFVQDLANVSYKDRQALVRQFLLYHIALEIFIVFLKQFWHVDHVRTLFIMTHIGSEDIQYLAIKLEFLVRITGWDDKCLKPALQVERMEPENISRQVVTTSTHLSVLPLLCKQ